MSLRQAQTQTNISNSENLHGGGACMAVQNAEQLWALQKQSETCIDALSPMCRQYEGVSGGGYSGICLPLTRVLVHC